MTTAFTVGRTSSYDRSLGAGEPVYKLGSHQGYGGGWVWQSAAEARDFIGSPLWLLTTSFGMSGPDFSVYEVGLPGCWQECATPDPDPEDGVHRLTRDARVLAKVTP